MSELANYFSNINDVEIHLIVLSTNQNFYNIANNVTIHKPNFEFNNKYRLYYTFKTILFLRKKIKDNNLYSLLSFGEMYNSFVLLSSLFLKTKVYVSDRSKPDKNWGFFHENLRKILYKNAFGIIAQTSYSKNYLQKITNHKNIIIIPNPVKKFEKLNLEKKNIILNVGRLIPSKKIDLLLKMFSEIDNKDWKLWIVGNGPEHANLIRITEKLNLSDKVTFWGARKDVENFYGQAKIFSFTSISEGFPNAILEAMAAGLPIISFNCVAGPSDLIDDNENGYLIPELELELYKEKLVFLLNNENQYLAFSKNAISKSEKFNLQIIGNQFLKALKS